MKSTRLTDTQLHALYYALRESIWKPARSFEGKKKLLSRTLQKLEDECMGRRRAAIFQAGAKAAKAGGSLEPKFKGLYDKQPRPLGSMEAVTFYQGVKSVRPDFRNPYLD